MDSSRNDLIRDILTAFDTIDQLRYDNRYLRERLQMFEDATPIEAERVSTIDEQVLKYGRKGLMKEVLQYWHNVQYTIDKDTGTVSIESYEEWLEHATYKSKIPSWCSVDDFYEYFRPELEAIYEDEREKAMAEAHNER